jgi:hypothetical protein
MNKKALLYFSIFTVLCCQVRAQKTAYTIPEVNKILREMHQYISVELDDSVKLKAGLTDAHYLIPLSNYIDYNVIGKGRVAILNDDELREFIIRSIHAGTPLDKIARQLIVQYNKQKTIFNPGSQKEDAFHIGGFFSGEVEYHQEPDGKFRTLLELNQFSLYFASHFNFTKKNNIVNVFAEFNPIPEEVIHQVDEVAIKKGSMQDTLRQAIDLIPGEATIPFERLFVSLGNVGGSGINLTFGQFRNPFGLWSDYSSHRNFTSSKNNTLVNGFALKKIELGAKIDFRLHENWDIEAAVVYGRFGRTTPLYREDFDSKKDFVTHITYSKNNFSAGASAYLAEFSLNKRTAYGIDLGYRSDKLLVTGEYIVQRNRDIAINAPNISPFIKELSSNAGYLQLDYALTNKLHLYGLYDYWKMKADGEVVNKAGVKIFHGLKYFINAKARWTILEYGHLFHTGFDKSFTHLSSQLEINF